MKATMKKTINPRVYVGTWKKYNDGNLDGGWVALRDYDSYREFMRACYDLHKDEQWPELMVQDYDDMPDGLTPGEYIYKSEYNDIIEACEAADKAAAVEDKSKGGDKALLPAFLEEMKKQGKWYDEDYERKRFSYAIRLDGGELVEFDKPSIKTSFCWADEGPDYDDYKYTTATEERLKRYFIAKNLDKYDYYIKPLEAGLEPDASSRLCLLRCDGIGKGINVWRCVVLDKWDVKNLPGLYGDMKSMTDSDRVAIMAALKHERAKFEKRLNSYLKRYGVSKLRTWTYWADE